MFSIFRVEFLLCPYEMISLGSVRCIFASCTIARSSSVNIDWLLLHGLWGRLRGGLCYTVNIRTGSNDIHSDRIDTIMNRSFLTFPSDKRHFMEWYDSYRMKRDTQWIISMERVSRHPMNHLYGKRVIVYRCVKSFCYYILFC